MRPDARRFYAMGRLASSIRQAGEVGDVGPAVLVSPVMFGRSHTGGPDRRVLM